MVGRRRVSFTDQQLIALHKKGMIDREIGEKLGANKVTVNVHRRRLGLKTIRKHRIKDGDKAHGHAGQQTPKLNG